MKKYSSGSFIDAAVRVYGSEADIITSFPASIIANGGNITPWSIYGNTSSSQSVGEKTTNLFSGTYTKGFIGTTYIYSNIGTSANCAIIPCEPSTTYTITKIDESNRFAIGTSDVLPYNELQLTGVYYVDTATTYTFTTANDAHYIVVYVSTGAEQAEPRLMANAGSSALPYEPYGYKLPVVIGSNTTNIYMADVLRMSSGADPVYDIMSSTGTITRNVDTDGTPLITPTTESFTAPTLATVAGSQSVSFDTTVKPSRAELTYTGWHIHDDKKRSGGAWV